MLDIVIRAVVVGTLISLCSALLGVPLVLKRYSMIGDGLSHVAFGCAAIALATRLSPLAFSLPCVIVAAFILLKVGKRSDVGGDAAIAIAAGSALALGIASNEETGIGLNEAKLERLKAAGAHAIIGDFLMIKEIENWIFG